MLLEMEGCIGTRKRPWSSTTAANLGQPSQELASATANKRARSASMVQVRQSRSLSNGQGSRSQEGTSGSSPLHSAASRASQGQNGSTQRALHSKNWPPSANAGDETQEVHEKARWSFEQPTEQQNLAFGDSTLLPPPSSPEADLPATSAAAAPQAPSTPKQAHERPPAPHMAPSRAHCRNQHRPEDPIRTSGKSARTKGQTRALTQLQRLAVTAAIEAQEAARQLLAKRQAEQQPGASGVLTSEAAMPEDVTTTRTRESNDSDLTARALGKALARAGCRTAVAVGYARGSSPHYPGRPGAAVCYVVQRGRRQVRVFDLPVPSRRDLADLSPLLDRLPSTLF